jgi:TetR/AcrR family transcriptional repressor of nem operon
LKVSKQQSARNRRALIEAAGRLIRERGIDGVGVAEICAEAGLTHGALYAQFPSKEALAAEALTDNLHRKHEEMTAPRAGAEPTLGDYLTYYLSRQHRDNLAEGCAMAASASEIGRQGEALSARFTDGFAQLVEVMERSLDDRLTGADRRQRALAVATAMIGGVALARATAKASPALSDEILVALRRVLGQLSGNSREAAHQSEGR